MGGSIEATSVYGEGSTFSFTLEFEKSEEVDAPASPFSGNIDASDIRVLIVDDDADICEYFVDIAIRFNVYCDAASSGEEALKLIESGENYNICFVDWKMPGINGIELSQRIKEMNTNKAVIIMISSAEWQDIEADAKAVGLDRFLSKPVFPSEFIECLNTTFAIDLLNEKQPDKCDMVDRFWGYRVLLVEDMEINREIMIALLEPTLIDIDCAENGAEAVRIFSEAPEKYNIIFMDLQMPKMDGYEATRTIRALESEKARTIPIIAMTANAFKEDVDNCLEAGMNNHLGKPLDFDAVLGILRQYLFKQKPAKERRREDRRKRTDDRRQVLERRKGNRRKDEFPVKNPANDSNTTDSKVQAT
jgi:CheY-like chemotaxis protein